MNYFEPEQPDLFASGVDEKPVVPLNEGVTRRTAQMAALAELNPSEQAGRIFQTMTDRTAAYEAQIATLGDSEVRMEAANRQKERQLSGLSDVIKEALPRGDQELTQGAVQAYTNLAAMDVAADAAYALERQAVENIQNLAAAGNITQARVMLGNLERGNALDVIRDVNAKRMILQNMIDKAQVAVEDQGIIRDVADFFLGWVPLNASLSAGGNVDIDDGMKNWYDGILSGQRIRREAETLWDMPLKEFSQFVNEDFIKNLAQNTTLLGYKNNNEELALLTQLGSRTSEAWVTNSFNFIDNVGLLAPVAKPVRGAMGLAGTMVRNGARREAAELTAKAALDVLQDSTQAAARSGLSVDELSESLAVRAVSTEAPDATVAIAMDADAALNRGRALMAMRPELEQTARLNPEEIDHAVSVMVERIERQFGREVKDVNIVENTLTGRDVTRRVEMTMGKKSGGGFSNEAQANRFLGSIGETGEVVADESGQWFAKVTIDMPETGFYTNLLNVQTPSPMRFVLNARNVGDITLQDAAQVAGNKRNALLKTLVEPYSNTFRALNGGEREALGQVLQAGETHAKWFTKDQIETLYKRRFNRMPTEKELKAYQAARDINDIEFALRNDDVYKQRVTKGYRSVSFDLRGRGSVDRTNAIIDRELKSIPKQRIYDVSGDIHYTKENPMTPKVWERLKGQGYQLVTTEVPETLADGTRIKTFLIKGKDMNVENLRSDQISYRPGGHRMYRGKYFVKQTVQGVQPDTMEKFLDNPNTYIAAMTRAEATKWANTMEAARQAMLRGETKEVLDEILGGFPNMPDADEFLRKMDDGTFQKNTKFDTYYDREMPDEYLADGQNLEFIDPEDTGFNGFLRTNGRMYTGRKGEQLPDYQGNLAPLLDPYETLNRSLMNIASLTSFGDYKMQSIERWMQTFGKHLDIRDLPEGLSDMRLFMEAPLKKGGNASQQRIRNEALAQKKIIQRTLGWKTENDLRSDEWQRRTADFIAGSRVDGVIPNIRRDVSEWWTNSNPIAALRGFAFDLKLGLFNVAQLPLQLSTAAAATALSPKLGMQGWAMIAPMRFMLGGRSLTKEAFENRLDQLVKNGVNNLGGFKDAKEFKDFVRSATRSGFFDLGGTHGLMDHYGPNAALNGFASGVERTRDAGRFFFFESERWNRIVAWRIAWDEAVQSGLKVDSPEFAQRLAGRAEEYSFNMSRESQAWWQKGVMSIPTQFWAYNARMLEAMTVGNFTPAQKLRLILSQSALYGSAGLPVAAVVSDLMKRQSGETPSLSDPESAGEKALAVIDRGLLDTAIYHMTGSDLLVGRRYGTGTWLGDTVGDIFGMSQYGEVSAADVLGGATYSILGQVGQTLRPVVEYMTMESGDTGKPMMRDSLLRMAQNVSTVGNVTKALMVYNYGVYMSTTGSIQVDGLPPQTAFGVALSLQPAEMAEITTMMNHFKDKKKVVDDAAKVINNYRTRMINQPDQAQTLGEEVNAFVRLLPDDVRRDALQRVQREIHPSMYAGLAARLEKEQAEQDGLAN